MIKGTKTGKPDSSAGDPDDAGLLELDTQAGELWQLRLVAEQVEGDDSDLETSESTRLHREYFRVLCELLHTSANTPAGIFAKLNRCSDYFDDNEEPGQMIAALRGDRTAFDGLNITTRSMVAVLRDLARLTGGDPVSAEMLDREAEIPEIRARRAAFEASLLPPGKKH